MECLLKFSLDSNNCVSDYYMCFYDNKNEIHRKKFIDFKIKNASHGIGFGYTTLDSNYRMMFAIEKKTDEIVSYVAYSKKFDKERDVYILCVDSITTSSEHESKGLSTLAIYNCLNYEIEQCAPNIINMYVYAQSEGTKIIFSHKFGFRNVTNNDELYDIAEITGDFYDYVSNSSNTIFLEKMESIRKTILNCETKVTKKINTGGYKDKYLMYKHKYTNLKNKYN